MIKSFALPSGLVAGTLFSLLLSGCLTTVSSQSGYHRPYRTPQTQATVVIYQDDYDYYPGYEIYYSRNHHDYIYREGNRWVRKPAPLGVSLDILLVAPSVRMDFHDEPEHHHDQVIRSYPKNWRNSGNSGNQNRDRHHREKKNKKHQGRNDGHDDQR